MRVLFVTLGSLAVPSSRIRVFQYVDYLRGRGLDARVFPYRISPRYERFLGSVARLKRLPGALYYLPRLLVEIGWRFGHGFDRLRLLGEIAIADVVYVQKAVLAPLDRLALRLLRKPYLFDFDDAIFARNLPWGSESEGGARRRVGAIESLARRAFAVVTNDNPLLEEYARSRARRAVVLPAGLEPKFTESPDPPRESGAVTLGWVGLAANFYNLQWLEPALGEVARRHPQARLRVVWGGGERPTLGVPMPTEYEPWSYDREVELGRSFDVGLLPLVDNEFNRGKMARKAIEYAALGTPSVSSPVGLNLRVFRDGENVLLARTHEEWVRALGRLIEDEGLRLRIGRAAAAAARAHYGFDVVAVRLLALLREASARGEEASGRGARAR